MRRLALIGVLLCICSAVAAQDVTVRDNMLHFTSIAAYERYANNEVDRSLLYDYTYGNSGVTTRAEVQEGAGDEDLYPDFLNLILNQDNIVRISGFLVKVDLVNARGLALDANHPNAYWALVNEDWSAPLIYFSEEDDGIEILESIENGTIAYARPQQGPIASSAGRPEGRIDTHRRCPGAARYKCDDHRIWDQIDRTDPEPGCIYDLYRMDYKVVYQKAIIYFSLQSKQKSIVGCSSTNWVFVPGYDAQLRLEGNVRYRKRCGGEVVEHRVLTTVDREQNWRPYEGSRSLSHYDFAVTFGIDHDDGNPPNYTTTACAIRAGYSAGVSHPGMTWRSLENRSGAVHVGADGATNAYQGDTPASTSLPVLCLRVDHAPVPAGITPDFYNGWARGSLALTPSVQGSTLTSRAAADSLCASHFGPAWRMAEFHDGYYGPSLQYSGGWSYWGYGNIPVGQRFWVAINDQPANPWN